jgi:hypothetical protein
LPLPFFRRDRGVGAADDDVAPPFPSSAGRARFRLPPPALPAEGGVDGAERVAAAEEEALRFTLARTSGDEEEEACCCCFCRCCCAPAPF